MNTTTFDNPTLETTLQTPANSALPTIRKQTFFALLIVAQLLFVASFANAQPYQITNTQNSVVGDDRS